VSQTAARASGGPAPPGGSRLAVIGVVVAVVALSAFVDRASKGPAPAAAVTVMPVAAPASALSSSWFCGGPTGSPALVTTGRLVIANAASQAVTGTVTLLPSSGSPVSKNIRVGPDDRLVVPETGTGGAAYLGAVVDLNGGQAAVQQVVAGAGGTSSTACATAGSSDWYFPAGTTQEGSALELTLINPYPETAIADLSFTTEQGVENPDDFEGIVIPAGSVVGLDLGSHLRDRASIATTVNLRVGQVAAFETETVQAQTTAQQAAAPAGTVAWPPGLSVVLGAPSAGTSWSWPSGVASNGATEQYVIYNPGDAEAQVSLGVDLDDGSADPFQLDVDPQSVTVITSNSESRIPKGIGHAAWLRSTNGVAVVAERLVRSTAPAGQTGLAQVLGSRLAAGRWLVAGDGATDAVSPALVVYNPGTAPVTVAISSLAGFVRPLPGQATFTIGGHHRDVLAPSSSGVNPTLAGPLVVVAQGKGQVVVEQDVSPAAGIGVDAAIGVPLDQ
jgi:hypothetical protein